ncbi:bel1 homeotic protein, putative [Ricinus communis]|uniref:Bel1 homeotic protein, putative n=1 Tax=Ricinus communis TaxID=3988 RepID=B9SV36_RICCO|nr:bel1 homeotic protein, putative [Ricinus communis]
MAEGFEPYHVPQQSRRDKLRIVTQTHPQDLHSCASLLPLYDPSLLSSDLLACAAYSNSLSPCNKPNPVSLVKEEGPHLMVHDINASSDPFLYTPNNLQNLRDFDHPFNGSAAQALPFKPEPLSTTTGQGLSLSLSSHHTHQTNLPLELNLQRYDSAVYDPDKVTATGGGGGYSVAGIIEGSGNLTPNELSRSSVPLGPLTGYASILKGSRFLKPAQQLLEEFCDVGRGIYIEKITADASLMDSPVDCLNACGTADDPLNCGDGESRRKKSRLISMLDEVYRRYKHYYQQMQAVVTSFECVAGLANAAPYASLALKTMSKHFRSLKIAITDQLQFTNKGHGQLSHGKEEAIRLGNIDRGPYVQRPGQSSGFVDHQPVWRPQRGLPERAVTVLRAWLFEHFLHPYPTDTDKLMLAKQTGLSRSQVSNWFINARVRLWKPMVEEIHMLETRQAQKATQKEDQNANRSSDHAPLSNSAVSDNPSTSIQRVQDIPSKRTRNDLPDLPLGSEEPLNLSYNNMSNHPPIGVGLSPANGSGGVSLTLGLHQNNGIGLSEPFPMNAAQRFGLGLETNSQGFVMGGFEVQNRHFGRDVMGGQLLHDFVG